MNRPTTPQRPHHDGRRQLPAWLAALALAVHLLAPGLCLAQMLSAAPLGAVCTASPPDGSGPNAPLPGDEGAGRHALEACEHCVASPAAMVGSAAPVSDWPPRTAAAPAPTVPSFVSSSTAWRPPPRGPPHAA